MAISSSASTIAFIIPTRNRPARLRRLLESLAMQTCQPDQLVVVDSSPESDHKLTIEFPQLSLFYKHYSPPSAAKQRNAGITEVRKDIELIGFVDDDIEFAPDALEKMLDFWNSSPLDMGGIGFNLVNHPDMDFFKTKTSFLSKWFGFYSEDKGAVLPSGFQTMIGYAKKNKHVRWLPSGAVVWKREVLEKIKFDEWFEGYSYLEDLDFSYLVGKRYKLAVCAAAKHYHFPPESGRGTPYAFGKREVINRVYFVKKNRELSIFKCYIATFVRVGISLSLALSRRDIGFFKRAIGSLVGIYLSLFVWPDVLPSSMEEKVGTDG